MRDTIFFCLLQSAYSQLSTYGGPRTNGGGSGPGSGFGGTGSGGGGFGGLVGGGGGRGGGGGNTVGDGSTGRFEDVIPGVPGDDYPTLAVIPPTSFSCSGQVEGGYYADTEAGCQVFHICARVSDEVDGLSKYSFLCGNGTVFDQERFICNWWFNVDCSRAESLYSLQDDLARDRASNNGPGFFGSTGSGSSPAFSGSSGSNNGFGSNSGSNFGSNSAGGSGFRGSSGSGSGLPPLPPASAQRPVSGYLGPSRIRISRQLREKIKENPAMMEQIKNILPGLIKDDQESNQKSNKLAKADN